MVKGYKIVLLPDTGNNGNTVCSAMLAHTHTHTGIHISHLHTKHINFVEIA